MINLNKIIKVTSSAYIPQIKFQDHTYRDGKLFITTVSLEKMYLNKYKRKDYQGLLNPFNVVIC